MKDHFIKQSAFTLIELLIVVLIIAILAAIAVPNFLEFQTRAKVSRVKSDQRTYATAIEAYAVDNNRYPIGKDEGIFGPGIWTAGPDIDFVVLKQLTTPISYISSIFSDPFIDAKVVTGTGSGSANVFFASTYDTYVPTGDWPANTKSVAFFTGQHRWSLRSPGPDSDVNDTTLETMVQRANNDQSNSYDGIYDPTNGTVSSGNIWRTNKGELTGGNVL